MIETFRTLTVRDSAQITYRILRGAATRRVLVLIHGMASNMTRWSEFVEQTSLRRTWDIIRIDLRGNGRSVYRGRITMELWCDDIVAILNAEGYSRAVLAGHCLGANAAMQFAIRYPVRTEGLILIEPLFPLFFSGALKRIQPFIRLISPTVAVIRLLNRLGIYRRYLPHLDLRELDKEMRSLTAVQGSSEALVKKYASPCFDLRFLPVTAYLQSLRELSRPLPLLADIHHPVLLMVSTGKVFSDPDGAKEICKTLNNCKTALIDSHHWIPTEKPGEMRTTIEEWCGGLNI
ncbi:MAG: alpha/beta fold hydrolase [Betaproteobacteria bacterium]